ncbi:MULTISPECIES: DUF4917 family protein [Bacillus]|jgi:hypothetical protein|uniref:DUF4917 family protein n=1 Tax=Bacillus TaxID=1386 RepID=UPI00096AE7C4|nr:MULTISPECIES: DUF4917 family protein [Bacillus]AUZ29466.1 DUF4917 domain-containing protein [Bacillus licheniformis]
MEDQLITYSELVKKNNILLDNLLFGNGFSIHFNQKFRYNNLYEQCKDSFEAEDQQMFEKFDTQNFETILRALHTTMLTNRIFNIQDKNIDASYNRIKQSLINAVREVHPQFEELHPQKGHQLRLAFNIFKKSIFTTNYDLLPYWALLSVLSNRSRKVSDGFGYDSASELIMFEKGAGVSPSENPLELYYLHGALHFYMRNGEVVKITRGKNPAFRLLDIITNTYEEGHFPLYVSEGTWQQKLQRIENNKYLMHCYRNFKRITGGLTIYGQSLDRECDMHIINAIKESNITDIAYGIYDKEKAPDIINEITVVFRGTNKNLHFFDSSVFFNSLEELEWLKLFA